MRLILEGEDRLCRNREVREHNNCISYSHISEGWCELVDKRQNVLEKLIIEEAIGEFMDLLTDRLETGDSSNLFSAADTKEKCHGCLELQNRQYQNVFHRQSRK